MYLKGSELKEAEPRSHKKQTQQEQKQLATIIEKRFFCFGVFTLTVGGVRGSLRCCWRGLPWLKSIRPLGSVVLKSKEMDPAFFAVHLLRATKDSGVSKVTGSSVATLSHLKDTTPLTWVGRGQACQSDTVAPKPPILPNQKLLPLG